MKDRRLTSKTIPSPTFDSLDEFAPQKVLSRIRPEINKNENLTKADVLMITA